MSSLTSEDLHREFQLFEETAQEQLSNFITAIQDCIRKEVHHAITLSLQVHLPSSQIPPSAGVTEQSYLPGQLCQREEQAVHVTTTLCAVDADKSAPVDTTKVAIEEAPPKQACVDESAHPKMADDELKRTDGGMSELSVGQKKLSILHTAAPIESSYMAKELRELGYFHRCNAKTHMDLFETPIENAAVNTTVVMLGKDTHKDTTSLVKDASDRSAKSLDHRTWRGRVYTIVDSDIFEQSMLVFISLNAIFMGYVTEVTVSDYADSRAALIKSIEVVFFLIFAVELGLRVFIWRWWFFSWNAPTGGRNSHLLSHIFDTILVLVQGLELMLELNNDGNALRNFSALRALRIFRVARLVRLVKVVNFFGSLRIMTKAIYASGAHFFWALISIGLISYLAAMFFTEVVWVYSEESGDDRPELQEYFGSLQKSWLSLLKSISGGVDWGDVARPLSNLSWTHGILPFLVYLFFMLIVTWNVITGMFLEGVMDKAKQESELQLVRSAYNIFKAADHNDNNTMSKDDFRRSLDHPDVNHFFEAISIDVQQAEVLFELLDSSNDGVISCDEFLRGCLRLRGTAKALDLLVLSREVNFLIAGVQASSKQNEDLIHGTKKMIKAHMQDVEHNLYTIHGILDKHSPKCVKAR